MLLFARVGDVHGTPLRFYATVQQARDLSAGSDVWLGGDRIGVVEDVRFLPPTADTTERVLVAVKVQAKYQDFIRRDASVQIRPGGNLVGAPVVAIGIGSPSAARIVDQDTLHSSAGQDIERVRLDMRAASSELPAILANFEVLSTQLRAANSTLGALGLNGGARLDATRAGVTQTMASIGTLQSRLAARPGRRGEVGGALAYVQQARARADSIFALLGGADPNTSIGRFRRDSTLLRNVQSVRTELGVAAELLASSRGTAGRLQRDSAIVYEIARSRAAMDRLFTDLARNPLRYLPFP